MVSYLLLPIYTRLFPLSLLSVASVIGARLQKTTYHFLIDCRKKKYLVCKLIWAHFFPLSLWSRHTLLKAILHIVCPQQNSVQSFDSSSIFGCSLLMIWKVHWRFIFDSHPSYLIWYFKKIFKWYSR
ncbi:hypothetical protein BCV71DRAFT_277511 [Rhizopus microsporus]|uniref:Uncharacterized protein n=1 Tax=Rhizopus microsporus TaxID=58291 RepID=A0A1X0SA07_RHIZD|nr:hypothetical protein BCV71DRAFT_277511 [Rhizopus microsporus]